jgi:phenylacetic acid degradation operon negative regulatory protein
MSTSGFGRWIANALSEIPLRTNSLIITLYGDAIAPHGSTVWLGSLIDLVAPLGVNDRAVRTSVFRLMQEGWLNATPIGRRSAYGLTSGGRQRINHAYRRIYDTPHETWNGEWQLVVVPEGALATNEREALRRDLLWDGYGALAPGVFAHPSGNVERLREVLMQTGSGDKVALFKANTLKSVTDAPLQTLVQQCWRLDELAADYLRFVERFRPTLKWLAQSKKNPEQHFLLRTLLIHEFRRVQLRDPQLPDVLLANHWPGHTARQLCHELYELALPLSEAHLLKKLGTPDGGLPPADKSPYRRFGGLSALGDEEAGQQELADGAPGRNRTNT